VEAGQGPREAPAKNNHVVDAVVTEDVEEHVGKADGKAKRKRGKRKRSVTVGRVNTARLLDMCGNHG
jgi:hypothetical protein